MDLLTILGHITYIRSAKQSGTANHKGVHFIPLEERLCTLCEFNEIEDESHFLFKCSLYDELRREWVSHIVNKTANFLELDKINKFKVIFDTHHRITAKFILRCYQLRKESLYRI